MESNTKPIGGFQNITVNLAPTPLFSNSKSAKFFPKISSFPNSAALDHWFEARFVYARKATILQPKHVLRLKCRVNAWLAIWRRRIFLFAAARGQEVRWGVFKDGRLTQFVQSWLTSFGVVEAKASKIQRTLEARVGWNLATWVVWHGLMMNLINCGYGIEFFMKRPKSIWLKFWMPNTHSKPKIKLPSSFESYVPVWRLLVPALRHTWAPLTLCNLQRFSKNKRRLTLSCS